MLDLMPRRHMPEGRRTSHSTSAPRRTFTQRLYIRECGEVEWQGFRRPLRSRTFFWLLSNLLYSPLRLNTPLSCQKLQPSQRVRCLWPLRASLTVMAVSSATDTTYFDKPQFSDLTIRLSDDRIVHVHRVILCRGSEYFRKLLVGGFSESGAEEIKLLDDDPDAMIEVLRAIYGIAYPSSGVQQMNSWVFHTTVYVTAEKYQLEATKQHAFEALACLVLPDSGTQDPWSIIQCNPIEDYTSFFAAIRTVFNGTLKTDDPARLHLARCCLWSAPVLMATEGFKDLMLEIPDLAVLLFERQMAVSKNSCTGCTHQYIDLSVYDCTGQTVAHGRAAVLATPNDYVRTARKLITSGIDVNSVEAPLLCSLGWEFNSFNNWEEIGMDEFDTTFAEVSRIGVPLHLALLTIIHQIISKTQAVRLAGDPVDTFKIKFKACVFPRPLR